MIKKTNVNDIILEKKDVIKHNDGNILKLEKFGNINDIKVKEIYFTEIYFNKIKGWKKHKEMTCKLSIPYGKVKFVFFDDNKKFLDIIIQDDNFSSITIPPNIWFAFKGLNKDKSIIINLSNKLHDSNEVINKNINEINYQW